MDEWRFTDKLRHMVNHRRLSQRRVAERSNLDAAYVNRLLTGERRNPSAQTIIKLALSLALSADETDELLDAAGYPAIKDLFNNIVAQPRTEANCTFRRTCVLTCRCAVVSWQQVRRDHAHIGMIMAASALGRLPYEAFALAFFRQLADFDRHQLFFGQEIALPGPILTDT